MRLSNTNRRVSRIQLVEEPLVPSVDAVLKNLLDHVKKAIFPKAITVWQSEFQSRDEVLWLLSVDKDVVGQSINADRGISLGFLRCGVIGSPDEGDNEALDSIEQLQTY